MALAQLIPGGGIGLESYRDDFSVNRSSEWWRALGSSTLTWDTANKQLIASNGAGYFFYVLKDLTLKNFTVEIEFSQADYDGILLRYNAEDDNGYMLRFADDSSPIPSFNASFYRRTAGIWTSLGSDVNITLLRGTKHKLRVEVEDSTFRVYINNTLYRTWTDSTYPNAGQVGLWKNSGTVSTGIYHSLVVNPITPSFTRLSTSMDMFLHQTKAQDVPNFVTPLHWTKNLLTLNQASVETDTTGFSNAGSNTFTRSTAWAAQGQASLRVENASSASDWAGPSPITVRTGYVYIASATVYNPNAFSINVFIGIAGTGGQASVTLAPGEAKRLQTTPFTSNATGTSSSIRFWESTGQPFHVGKIMFEQKNTFASGWIPGGTTFLQPDDGLDHYVEATDNLVPYSQYPTHSSWNKANTTATRVKEWFEIDGHVHHGYDSLVENTSVNVSHSLNRTVTYQAGTWYTVSAYVKANGRSRIKLIFSSYVSWTGGLPEGSFDIANGTVLNANSNICRIWRDPSWPEGWYRCSMSVLNLGTPHTSNVNIQILNDSAQSTYTGDGKSGIYIFGIQVEAKGYATPYNPSGPTNNCVRPEAISGIIKPTTNLLTQNQSTFDVDTSGWGGNSANVYRSSEVDMLDGNTGLLVVPTSTGTTRGCNTSTRIPITVGKTYTFSAYLRNRSDADVAIYMEIYWYDAPTGGTSLGTRGLGPTKLLSSKNWQRLHATGVAPSGATHALVTVYTVNSVTTAQGWFMDKCQFEEGAYPTPWVLGGTSRALTTGETLGLFVEEASGANICTNGSFATNTTGWSTSNGTGMNGAGARVWDDDLQAWCYEYTVSTAGSWGIFLGSIGSHSFDTTKQYTVSMKVKKVAGPHDMSLGILGSSGTNIVMAAAAMGFTDLTGVWTNYERTFTPAMAGVTPYLYFSMSSYGAGVVQTWRVAFVKLEQKPYATSYVNNGETTAPDLLILPMKKIASGKKGKVRTKFRMNTLTRQEGSSRFLWDMGGAGANGLFAEVNEVGTLFLKAGNGSGLISATAAGVKARIWHTAEFEWDEAGLTVSLDDTTVGYTSTANQISIAPFCAVGHRYGQVNTQSSNAVFEYFEIEDEEGRTYLLDFTTGSLEPAIESLWTSGWRQNKHRTVIKEVELTSDIPEGSYVNMEYAASVDGTEATLTDWSSDLRSLPDLAYLKYKAELVGKPQTAAPKLTQIKVTPL